MTDASEDAPRAESSRQPRTITCDAVVVGGGPSGSAAAAILAEKGRDVVVLERERFPRYA
ncbi:MAG: FAD-dependent oxidoreductase, partial [Planctomycetota bacterium]|nr:FAD-dependent oxidoreductase [Planctomycetota bacterium]